MNLCANTAKPHAGDLRDTVMHGCALLCTVVHSWQRAHR